MRKYKEYLVEFQPGQQINQKLRLWITYTAIYQRRESIRVGEFC